MAKRQSHKQARIGKQMEATLNLWCVTTDPDQREKLNGHYKMLRLEWEQVRWEQRFTHYDRDGNLIDREQDEPQDGSD